MWQRLKSLGSLRVVLWLGLALVVSLQGAPWDYPGAAAVAWVSEACFKIVVIAVAWRLLSAVPPTAPVGSAADGRERPSSFQEQVHGVATQQLKELELGWRQRRRKSPASDSEASRRIAQVAGLASAIAQAMEADREGPDAVASIRRLSHRLAANGTGDEWAGAGPFEAFRPPARAEERISDPCLTAEADYLMYVARHLEDARSAAEAQEREKAGVDWRQPAEDLVRVVESRRPAEPQPDPRGFRSLHSRLMEILDWEEIEVRVGAPIDRTIHAVDSMRETLALAPNRVLEILAPGYRNRVSQAVCRKVTVVASEQALT